jgi:hypothetical protein
MKTSWQQKHIGFCGIRCEKTISGKKITTKSINSHAEKLTEYIDRICDGEN